MKNIFLILAVLFSGSVLAHPGHEVSTDSLHPFWHALNGMDYFILITVLLLGLVIKYMKS